MQRRAEVVLTQYHEPLGSWEAHLSFKIFFFNFTYKLKQNNSAQKNLYGINGILN